MNLSRPLLFIDIEGTGVDPAVDRIVELALVKISPDGSVKERCARFNPGCPIPDGAFKVHGIGNADVADCPTFEEKAQALITWFRDCDLAGYNLANYDVPLLWEEFYRAGITWDLTGVSIVDAGAIFKKKEQRTLGAAVQFYCGREHEDAHGALADTKATAEVLKAQIGRYADLTEMSLAQLAEFSRMEEMPRIDLIGTLVRDPEGFAVYTHKKVRGVRVMDDPGYGEWLHRQLWISQNVRTHLRAELDAAYQKQDELTAARKAVPA